MVEVSGLRRKSGAKTKNYEALNPKLTKAWFKGAMRTLAALASKPKRKIPTSEYCAKLESLSCGHDNFYETEDFYREIASEIVKELLSKYPDGTDAEDKSREAALQFFSKNNSLMYGFLTVMKETDLYKEITDSNFINSCRNIDEYARETAASMMDDFILDEFEKKWKSEIDQCIDK